MTSAQVVNFVRRRLLTHRDVRRAASELVAKALALAVVAFDRRFDNMTDGFVYGAAAGLGFGMTENLSTFLTLTDDPSSWGSAVVLRTFYSGVMHAMCSSVVGACVGHASFRERQVWIAWSTFGLALAVGAHALWNGLASAARDGLFVIDLVLLPLEIGVVAVVFELCVLDEARTIRRQLAEEVSRGVLPIEHPDILASWTQRARRGWLPDRVDHDRYVRVATDLAMRKQQLAELGSSAPVALDAEVRRLREELRGFRC
jgi:hypothetical protein